MSSKLNEPVSIYPINLEPWMVKGLIEKHCYKTWLEKTRFISRTSEFQFWGHIEANGDVNVHVHYSFDDGFVQGSGGLFTEIIRPFDAERLKKFRLERMYEMATDEHQRRLDEIRRAEIDNVFIEMFGDAELTNTKEIENAR